MISSLQSRLLLAVGVVAIAAAGAVAYSARQSTRFEFERFRNLERVRQSDDVAVLLDRAASVLDGRCCTSETVDAAAAGLPLSHALLVFDAAGTLQVAAGAGIRTADVRASLANDLVTVDTRNAAGGIAGGFSISIRGGPAKAIRMADGAAATVHVVPLPRTDRDQPAAQFLGSIDRRLLAATAGVAALALLVTWGLARRIVGPIAELRDATKDLAAGNLSRRVSERGSDEVAGLARGFNTMAAELERQEALRRNLVHDVAHELRTPLTALRCRVETVLDGLAVDPGPALRQINEEVTHLSELVNDLEELARAEARDLPMTIAEVHVSDVCRSAVRMAGLEGDARLHLDLDDGLLARADAVRLRQIVLNLLTNADRHTPAGQRLTARAFGRGAEAVVEVHNTGSTLSAEDRAGVFDRFYRADPSRQRATGGRGLGLAIVKHLAEAQGGRAWVESDAGGVTFGVALPGN
jgi:signal transduction histidine kinase